MKKELIKSIKERLEDEIPNRSPLKYLKEFDPETYIDTLISIVYLYTREKKTSKPQSIYMAEVISAIGHTIRNKLKQKKDSSLAAKTGAFLLYSFEDLEILQVCLGSGQNSHGQYIVQVLNDEAIVSMWGTLGPSEIEKLPFEKPIPDWKTYRNESGALLVKTQNKEVLYQLTAETHPIVFDCINKAQRVGWRINTKIYDLYMWALRNKTDAFSDIWEAQNPEAKATKLREAKAIGGIAKKFLNKVFYHLYYYDFRGRKYPATAYLHEQGSDLARGLLLRADHKKIGEEGFKWLLISLASNWAGDSGRPDGAKTDKIPLQDRADWALDNEEILLSYAENPKINQGWMQADNPWQFLAACFELYNLRVWQTQNGEDFENYDYESSLECYIDGSNNGSQHLAMLTKDEITAPHVNLVPLPLPGDLYKYVADHVWERLKTILDQYTKEDLRDCQVFIDNLIELKKQINASEPKSDQRRELVEKIRKLKSDNERLMSLAAPVFWYRIRDSKHKRKIVKRNVMTIPYGGTAYGLGQQIIDDARKHNIDLLMYLEHKWGAFLGREIYQDCMTSLERPMRLLMIFEQAGQKAEEEGRYLSWKVPVTDFPVVQNYTEGMVKKIWIQYGPQIGPRLPTGYFINTLQLAICFLEKHVPSKNKQSQGASPNIIHSLDAAHLMLTVHRCDFPVTTIHDSFGCLLSDMPKLYKTVRETFVELYNSNPLESVLADIKGDPSNVELGTLDVNAILESEYAFC